MAAGEGSGGCNAEVEEAADKECPVRIGHHLGSRSQVLSSIDSIGQEHGTNGFKNEDGHALAPEGCGQIFDPSLDIIPVALLNALHGY